MSVRLADRNKPPVNGFQFFQPETGFNLVEACPACRYSFDAAVQAIINHRRGNPQFNLSTDYNAVAYELDTANALRMLTIANADSYVHIDAAPAPNESPKLRALRTARPVAAGGAVLPKLATGVTTLADWLGDGAKPVEPGVANGRAQTCSGCKWNKSGDWSRWFTAPVSNLILAGLRLRGDLGMSTPFDEQLNVCEICSCPLKLKVHVPLENVKARLRPAVIDDLKENAPWCWILAEPR